MPQQILCAHRIRAESANAHRRAVQRERRNDRVHAAAVAQSSVHHRAGFVDAPPDLCDDPVNDLPQVRRVAKEHFHRLEPPATLDVHLVVTVHQDVGDPRIFQQRLQWSETECLVHHVVHELFLLDAGEQALFRLAQLADEGAHFLSDDVERRAAKVLHVQPLHQLLVQAQTHLRQVRLSLGGVALPQGNLKDRLFGHGSRPFRLDFRASTSSCEIQGRNGSRGR